MAEIHMTRLSENLKEVAGSANAMSVAAREAAIALNEFVTQHHDIMNSYASAKVLRAMGRDDLAMWYERP